LVALMELQSSRFRTRVNASGEPVLLMDQNRAAWDRLLIGRGLAALERARKLGRSLGPYALRDEPALKDYYLLPSVRGDLLVKLDRLAEAGGEFERAAVMTKNASERALLLKRAAACEQDGR
ncbi:DUF6596 domain-containing protein, partial [Paenibacillus whitsoniae]